MRAFHLVVAGSLALALGACGGGGGGGGSGPTPTYTVTGSVTGLTSGLSMVLQLNGGSDTPIKSNTSFTFSTPVASGANYAVTVKTQPVGLTCTITNGSGTMGGGNIANVAVACATAKYNVSVNIRGMPYGQSVTLLNNGGDTLVRNVDGTANFSTPIDYGQPYSVTFSLPTTTQQTCNLVGATAGAVAGTVTGPVDVVFDCPHFAYVTNEGDSTLSTYQVDNASGALTVPSSIPTIAVPYLITTTPNLAFAFVTSINNTTQGANGVDVYGINANNGVLSANGSPASGIQAYGLAFDPTGTYAIQPDFVAGNVSVYNVGGNGALTLVGGGPYAAGTNPDAVAVTHDGKYAYVPSGHGGTLYGYSLGAGTLTGLSSSPVTVSGAGGLAGLAIDPLGKFIYIGGNTTGNVFGYSIDDTTGALTAIAPGTFAAGANPSCVTIHPNGKFLYVANYGSDNVSGYLINPSSGALAPMAGSPFGTGINPESLTIDPAGQYAYVVNTRLNAVPAGTAGTVSVFSINQTSGVLTQITGSPFTAGINPQTMMFR